MANLKENIDILYSDMLEETDYGLIQSKVMVNYKEYDIYTKVLAQLVYANRLISDDFDVSIKDIQIRFISAEEEGEDGEYKNIPQIMDKLKTNRSYLEECIRSQIVADRLRQNDLIYKDIYYITFDNNYPESPFNIKKLDIDIENINIFYRYKGTHEFPVSSDTSQPQYTIENKESQYLQFKVNGQYILMRIANNNNFDFQSQTDHILKLYDNSHKDGIYNDKEPIIIDEIKIIINEIDLPLLYNKDDNQKGVDINDVRIDNIKQDVKNRYTAKI